ncbi:hypothetical protein CIHG_06975 [Coccidioides immitis H538.4]|uniref:Uncharacterized protein n=3 Tax=Coccidioides immitis TaxID=5501 RepID=A0A0J8QWB8_COCIT|nr:hypothetical protein CIRG_10020 [Coccidioides immitis RMSCC 2394]KMU77159.1 hypothetical protein CISG_06196 [Coccidioides immitis RMSCC 3703]KMU89303.1 hypothetical protein CIHG_06975 [Coccidioides immitis H538.4]
MVQARIDVPRGARLSPEPGHTAIKSSFRVEDEMDQSSLGFSWHTSVPQRGLDILQFFGGVIALEFGAQLMVSPCRADAPTLSEYQSNCPNSVPHAPLIEMVFRVVADPHIGYLLFFSMSSAAKGRGNSAFIQGSPGVDPRTPASIHRSNGLSEFEIPFLLRDDIRVQTEERVAQALDSLCTHTVAELDVQLPVGLSLLRVVSSTLTRTLFTSLKAYYMSTSSILAR